jgi:predicted DsbA family dithiol-disulfide isomerase
MEKKLDVYFDYMCPFCYTEAVSLQALKDKGVELNWKAWKLPTDANPPIKPEGYGEDAIKYLNHITQQLGLTLNPATQKRDTYLAHLGAKFAKGKGLFHEYHTRVFQAVWKYGEDVSDIQVLTAIAEEAGLNPEEFEQALDNNSYEQLLEKDFKEVKNKAIWTIPSYVGKRGEIQVHHFNEIPSLRQLENIV